LKNREYKGIMGIYGRADNNIHGYGGMWKSDNTHLGLFSTRKTKKALYTSKYAQFIQKGRKNTGVTPRNMNNNE